MYGVYGGECTGRLVVVLCMDVWIREGHMDGIDECVVVVLL